MYPIKNLGYSEQMTRFLKKEPCLREAESLSNDISSKQTVKEKDDPKNHPVDDI